MTVVNFLEMSPGRLNAMMGTAVAVAITALILVLVPQPSNAVAAVPDAALHVDPVTVEVVSAPVLP